MTGLVAAATPAMTDVPPPPPPPAKAPYYSPTTDATIAWLAEVDASREAPGTPPAELVAPPEGPNTGIHRCAGADGSAVFTDRRCEELGAVDSAAPSAGNASTRIFVRSCARSREALLDGLRDALGAQDANRLASYYHWTGMGNRAAYALMDRLQGFTERPLIDVRLVTSAARAEPVDEPFPGWYSMFPELSPEASVPRAPDLVRVDQMHAFDSAAAEVTYFHLRANAGCWWIQY
jgi:hypothetical protein